MENKLPRRRAAGHSLRCALRHMQDSLQPLRKKFVSCANCARNNQKYILSGIPPGAV
jgi:hypothetical protein